MNYSRRQILESAGALLALPALSSFAAGWSLARPTESDFLSAVRAGERERVRALLAADAALARARDEAGRSAYVLAWLHGHEELAGELRAAGLELDVVEAVLAEDWPRFEALAAAEPSLVQRAHPIGGTPLYAAALVGSLGCWRLRGQGCLPDARPEGGSGFTPARGALESPRASWARLGLTELCSNGGDVNAPQRAGSSVLHAAVQRRDALLVRLAVRKGARLEAVDEAGRTPLALAAELEWEAGRRLLANPGALVRDNRGSRFALDANREAIQRPDLSDVPQALQSEVTGSSHMRLARVRELVGRDERLTFSISSDDELAIEASAHIGSHEIIAFHLDHGAPLSLPTATSLGDLETISFWLDRDPSLAHERGAHDFPVMWYAALGRGSVEVAERLVEHGLSLEQESMGTTTLHWCVRRGDLELAHWLLERGADPEPLGYCWSRAGETPLQVAQAAENAPFVALLREGGARR